MLKVLNTLSIVGYAFIQLPEYILLLYGFIKRKCLSKVSSASLKNERQGNFAKQNVRLGNNKHAAVSDISVVRPTTASELVSKVEMEERFRHILERLNALESKQDTHF